MLQEGKVSRAQQLGELWETVKEMIIMIGPLALPVQIVAVLPTSSIGMTDRMAKCWEGSWEYF